MNRSSLLIGLLVSPLALSACGGAGSNDVPSCDPTQPDCPPPGTPTPPSCAAQTVAIPPSGGYSGKLTAYAAQFSNNGNCLQPISVSSGLPSGVTPFTPPTNGTVLLYFAINSSVTQDLSGYPGVSITLPAGTIVPGRTFYVQANYYENAWFSAFGPLQISGNTLFGGDVANNDVWSVSPGYPFTFVLYSVGP